MVYCIFTFYNIVQTQFIDFYYYILNNSQYFRRRCDY